VMTADTPSRMVIAQARQMIRVNVPYYSVVKWHDTDDFRVKPDIWASVHGVRMSASIRPFAAGSDNTGMF
jgi:hypothetical protein